MYVQHHPCCTTHTAYVRIRPANAGEGRYFVRVPEGTNSWRVSMEEVENYDEETWVEQRTYLSTLASIHC